LKSWRASWQAQRELRTVMVTKNDDHNRHDGCNATCAYCLHACGDLVARAGSLSLDSWQAGPPAALPQHPPPPSPCQHSIGGPAQACAWSWFELASSTGNPGCRVAHAPAGRAPASDTERAPAIASQASVRPASARKSAAGLRRRKASRSEPGASLPVAAAWRHAGLPRSGCPARALPGCSVST